MVNNTVETGASLAGNEPENASDSHSRGSPHCAQELCATYKGYEGTQNFKNPSQSGEIKENKGVAEDQSQNGSLGLSKFFKRWYSMMHLSAAQRNYSLSGAPNQDNGFYRVVRCPARLDTTSVNERVRTFVVIEVFESHQIINNWKCGDLVHYVNSIANSYGARKHSCSARRANSEHTKPVSLTSLTENNVKLEPRLVTHDQHSVKRSDGVTEIHHHYHYHCCHHCRNGNNAGNRDSRQISRLTYRDLRQVFTDSSPVPSIEVRRHCIVLCLPPLSCVIMADRVFLLVVEDMCIDELLLRLQRLQEKHMYAKQTSTSNMSPFAREMKVAPFYGSPKQQNHTPPQPITHYSPVSKDGYANTASRTCLTIPYLLNRVKEKDVVSATTLRNMPSLADERERNRLDETYSGRSSPEMGTEAARDDYVLNRVETQRPLSMGQCSSVPLVKQQYPAYFPSRSNDTGSTTGVSSPVELETLELLVSAAFSQLERDITSLEKRLDTITNNPAYRSPTSHGGEELHELKSHAQLYQDRVLLYDKALDDLMSNSEELVQMELSRLKREAECMGEEEEDVAERNNDTTLNDGSTSGAHNPNVIQAATPLNSGPSGPNPDLEILLEYFDQEIELLRQRVSRLAEKIESIERLASFHLSLSRNRLLRWDVGSGMVAVAVGAAALIAGIFGMNLKSSIEEDRYAFRIVSVAISCITIALFAAVYAIIRMTRL